ncbi:MAG: diacylglycerol kinase, partial [Actinobacteria bacterium ATB1]|nr:diacylglycerol kinase [Actinobacteria bacterium ATB1]
MTLRIVEWSTGNVGRHAIAGIDAHPDLELVGVWVSSAEKEGRDAGELAGLGRELGIEATQDADTLLALEPDCIVHTAMADHRLPEAVADLERFLRAGINVVSSGPVFLQFPDGTAPDEMVLPLREAAAQGGVSLFVSGIDPGFANDWLPLTVTSISERIDEVRCLEILNYATYDQPMIIFDIMGFGRQLDDIPLILQPGILTLAWGSVVRQIAAGVGVELDGVGQEHERVPAPETFEISAGTIEEGTAAALRFQVKGIRGGRPVAAGVVRH